MGPTREAVRPDGADLQRGKLQLASKAATITVAAEDRSAGEPAGAEGSAADGTAAGRCRQFRMDDMPLSTARDVEDPAQYTTLCKVRSFN